MYLKKNIQIFILWIIKVSENGASFNFSLLKPCKQNLKPKNVSDSSSSLNFHCNWRKFQNYISMRISLLAMYSQDENVHYLSWYKMKQSKNSPAVSVRIVFLVVLSLENLMLSGGIGDHYKSFSSE